MKRRYAIYLGKASEFWPRSRLSEQSWCRPYSRFSELPSRLRLAGFLFRLCFYRCCPAWTKGGRRSQGLRSVHAQFVDVLDFLKARLAPPLFSAWRESSAAEGDTQTFANKYLKTGRYQQKFVRLDDNFVDHLDDVLDKFVSLPLLKLGQVLSQDLQHDLQPVVGQDL